MKITFTHLALMLTISSSCTQPDDVDEIPTTSPQGELVNLDSPTNCLKLTQEECLSSEKCIPINGYSLDIKRKCSRSVDYAFCGDANPTIDGVESVLFNDNVCWFINETEQVPTDWQDLGDHQAPGSICDPMQFSNVEDCQ